MSQLDTSEIKSFNKKYKINEELAQKFAFITDKERQQSSSIAGKPKKMSIEIVKRFFKNPVVVISLVVFLSILLLSLLIPSPMFTDYIPNKELYNSELIRSLPPYSTPVVTRPLETTSGIWERLSYISGKMNENEQYKKFMEYVFSTPRDFSYEPIEGTPLLRVTYNTYSLAIADTLNAYIAKVGLDNITEAQVAEFVKTQRDFLSNVLLGTTSFGYDIWVTAWYATWKAIKIALIVVTLQALIGVSVGAYLGFNAGKLIDTISMRVIEIFLAPPTLIWILIFVSITGVNENALILALTIVGWPGFVGVTRLFIITVKNEEYITAAKAIGASSGRQIFVHALPAIIGKVATSIVKSVPGVILWTASLAFLGFFRVQEDTNLGQMLIQASSETGSNIWILLLPALILLFLSLSLNFIALGVHDALDPKVMSKGKKK
ncbi:ABC transporter permease [Metamycoplasma spumans]|uniref:ABC transporter permease n=1 Tax=Metamycoplasma spumans TaxID=92406 RepID=UPI0034DDAB66